jgi:hypothetical protein
MADQVSRRLFLSTAAPLGASFLAGCSQLTETDQEQTEIGATPHAEPQPGRPAAGSDPVVDADFSLAETTITHGDAVAVSVELELSGGPERTQSLALSVDDQHLDTARVTLAADESVTAELTGTPEETGTQTVTVGTHRVGTVVVCAAKPDATRDVGAHYYPWYGSPLQDWRDGEWCLESPSTPVLGSYDSTDPAVIEQHIDWCRQAGISWLNVSWWGPNNIHDDRVQEDIFGHPRADELSWSILYETTGRLGSDPVALDDEPAQDRFTADLQHLAEAFFSQDSYKQIDNRPVLYIWVAGKLRGDVETAYRAAVEAVGVEPYLIADIPIGSALTTHPVVEIADAVTSYGLYDPAEATRESFLETARSTYRSWYRAAPSLGVELIPSVAPGFDDTAITHDQRDNEPVPSTSDIYTDTGRSARQYADGPILVTSFNEWYEDTQIEPSEQHGTAYLDATAKTVACADREPPTFENIPLRLRFERTVPESELNPAVEHDRELTIMLQELSVKPESGPAVLDADIGTRPDGVEFILGHHGPSQADSSSWRWLGGGCDTIICVPSLPDSGCVELTGRGAANMTVSLAVDDEHLATTTITDEFGTHTLRLG